MFRVLRQNPEFRKLGRSQVVSSAGDWFNRMAVLALIGDLGGPDFGTGLGALFAVERLHLLVRSRHAHPDTVAGQASAVEGVVGLAQIEHHEVREIDEQVQGTLPHGEQQPLQPQQHGSQNPCFYKFKWASRGPKVKSERATREVSRIFGNHF